jgi:hypothetical protein
MDEGNQMVERVARAICCPEGCAGDTGSGRPCNIAAEDATSIRQARAAIEAMRAADLSKMRLLLHAGTDTWTDAQELWTAVIDAALTPPPSGEMSMDEWKPIETAPKDGTDVLAIWDVPGRLKPYGVVWWEDGSWHEYDIENEVSDPTHWMPLPEPPSIEAPEPRI